MAIDFSRVLFQLNSAGIQVKQPAVYQAIKLLIQYAQEDQKSQDAAIADNSSNTGNLTTNGAFLTWDDQASSLLNSRELLAGIGISFDDTVANQRTINSSGFHWAFKNDITNTQFKALPSTYIEIVPAPGTGKVLVPIWAYIQINAGTPYTNVDTTSDAGLAIAYGDWITEAFSGGRQTFTGDSYRTLFNQAAWVPDANALLIGYQNHSLVSLSEDEPFKLVTWNPSGDYTGGDNANTFRVGVAYQILDYDTGEFS